jgi:hypothetical protein
VSRFIFVEYDNNAEFSRTTVEDCAHVVAAKAKAGRIAKRNDGPVDLALDGDRPWSDRYITTAAPSKFHSSGYRLERLA